MMPVGRVPTPFRAGFAIWGTFTEDPVFPLAMKKPRRSEAFGFLVEVRGFAARCARSFRCGGCAALRAARQTLARLLRSAPQTGFEPHAPSLGMKKPRRGEAFMIVGGGKGVRTPGLRLAKPALSQLSYTPFRNKHPSGDSALAGVFIAKEDGGPDKIRTCDLPVISRTL